MSQITVSQLVAMLKEMPQDAIVGGWFEGGVRSDLDFVIRKNLYGCGVIVADSSEAAEVRRE